VGDSCIEFAGCVDRWPSSWYNSSMESIKLVKGDVTPGMDRQTIEKLRSFSTENLMELERQIIEGIKREVQARKDEIIEEARKKRKKAKRKRQK